MVCELNLTNPVKIYVFKRPKYQLRTIYGSYLDADLNKPIEKKKFFKAIRGN